MSFGLEVIVLGLIFSYFQPCQGGIKFRDGFHKPRIYEKAPAGTYVTTVYTFNPEGSEGSLQDVSYTLIEVRDYAYFQLDSSTGNLSTKKTIDKKAGDSYEIIIVAIHQGETRLLQMDIYVTVYNTFIPKFEKSLYRAELHTEVSGGTLVLQVKANDKDPVKYNKEIYYTMERNEASSYFALNENTGDILVRKKLNNAPKKLLFRVFAEDGGSPKRTSETFVEIVIKTISEPIDVTVGNTTETSVKICWKHPNYGQVNGYLVRYHEAKRLDASPSQVNLTTNASSVCTLLENVSPWTDYQFRLYAWNMNETGLGSDIVPFGTRPNFCARRIAVCRNGKCQTINHQPGYICHCETGYYGFNCDRFDPCSLNPCENYGTCRNISDSMYECQCASGFSGNSCNIFNPCAIRPSPCQNNGKCESKQTHTYHCLCSMGYYGSKCQYYDPCISSPCINGVCRNISDTDFQCRCNPGFTGKLCETDFNECSLNPCENGGTCTDGVNSYKCDCVSGYRGRRCQHIIRCPSEVITLKDKGKFEWKDTPHGKTAYLDCPYGTISSLNTTINTAKRKCKLLENNTVVWGKMDTEKCREKGFKIAEDIAGKLKLMTEDPNNLNAEKLASTAEQIQNVVDYAVKDETIARSMFSVISNVMAVNQTVLDSGDQDGTNTGKLVEAIDKYLSKVDLNEQGTISFETENVAIKATKVDEKTEITRDLLTFSPSYRHKDIRTRRTSEGEEVEEMFSSITLSSEVITLAQKQAKDAIRLKFTAFKNNKFFRPKRNCPKNSCSATDALLVTDCRVIQASVNNVRVTNLTDPVEYWIPTSPNLPILCVYWNNEEKVWSTDGLWSNQTDNYTLCFSNHLTAFSILLDPEPNTNVSDEHQKALSLISYIGCGLSVFGLFLTIITYSLFRCLNRDHSGKILLNLCISMLLMNLSFLANSIPFFRKELCTISAIFIHYFVLTTLSWMCVEAINIYQLLIHVFASVETRFMLKRFIVAWGIPFIIVAITAGINVKYYKNPNEYCMLSPENPYVYYISLLGPSCLILSVNLIVFIMVSRVLFTPRMNSKPGATKKRGTVTIAQIRGAFTVMVLLGITWVFGALAVKQLKLIFQYIFCIANSLQGLLIFIVRCLLYPEARCAWKQLISTGTLKRHRGVSPPGGSWYANSNSSQKQNGCSTSSRLNSSENTNAIVFNTNYWNSEKESSRSLPLKFPCLGTVTTAKNNVQQKEPKRKSNNTGLYGTTYARNSRDLPPPLNDPTIVYIDEEEQEKVLDNSHPSDVYKSLLERPDYFSQELEKRNTLQRTVTTFLTGREGQRDTPTASLLAESPHTEQSSVAESPAPTEQMPQTRNEKKKLSVKSKESNEDNRNEITTQTRMDSTEERTEL
ncbi:adhesion G protein-coupled receptor E1-like isoform X1 [Centruroides vittatus]|uniref:adhesion G protein-coupled receptor E1-like isoform X1 n=1 Tax=Centruroides vittatus TaxID=120091 RepID=UPI00350EC396